jgi:hypothetical protein
MIHLDRIGTIIEQSGSKFQFAANYLLVVLMISQLKGDNDD